MNTIEYYAVSYSGGVYEDAYEEERIFIGKSGAEAYFNEIRDNATANHHTYDTDGYYTVTDSICIAKADVDNRGCIVPDWYNPIKSLSWNYETHQWEEED